MSSLSGLVLSISRHAIWKPGRTTAFATSQSLATPNKPAIPAPTVPRPVAVSVQRIAPPGPAQGIRKTWTNLGQSAASGEARRRERDDPEMLALWGYLRIRLPTACLDFWNRCEVEASKSVSDNLPEAQQG